MESFINGNQNTSVGGCLQRLTSGYNNTSIGHSTLNNIITADNNTAVGAFALDASTASNNTALGSYAGRNITTGYENTLLGSFSGDNLINGYQNTFIGRNTGLGVVDGFQNVCIGIDAAFGADVNATTFICSGAPLFTPSTSNSLYVNSVRNTTTATAPLYYDPSTGEIQYFVSSQEYKQNIKDITYDTSKVFDINVVEFDEMETGIHCTGLIAQDVHDVDSNLVWFKSTKDDEGNVTTHVEGVDTYKITMYMLNEFKKMKAEINELKSQVTQLQGNI